MSKRASMMPAGPKTPTSLASTLVIAEHASLTGTNLISLGHQTVIHPRSKLNSTYAPIQVGKCCIISERCAVGLQSLPSADSSEAEGVVIEDYVVVEVGAIVEAQRIGEGSVIDINSKIGKGAIIGKHCKVGALCEVAEGEVLPDYTVIYGNGMRRVDGADVEDLKLKMVTKQVETHRKLIPSNIAKFQ